jgi:hypothetical protein
LLRRCAPRNDIFRCVLRNEKEKKEGKNV